MTSMVPGYEHRPIAWRAIVIPAMFCATGAVFATTTVEPARAQILPAADAQQPGAIRGVTQDSLGAQLPGVTVDIVGAGVAKRVIAGRDGSFEVRDLPAGRYRVTAALASFESWSKDDVSVERDKATNLIVQLRPGLSTEPGMAVVQPLTTAVRSADAILHVRIKSFVETTIAGDYFRYPETEHRAVVIDVIFDRDQWAKAGSEIRLMQLFAGTVQSAGKSSTGNLALHRPGDELIVLAERTGDRVTTLVAPFYEFKIENGQMRIPPSIRDAVFIDQMTTAAFADAARDVIARAGPLRLGPAASRVRAYDIWMIHMVLGKDAQPWLINAFGPGLIREPKWYVDVYLPPDHMAPRLRTGPVTTMVATLKAVEVYDEPKRWARNRTGRYAQVLTAPDDNPMSRTAARDIVRPFKVFGEFTDDELLAIVDLMRTSPAVPPPQRPGESPGRVEGTWPIQRISRSGETVLVYSLDLSPEEKSGEVVRLRFVNGGWTVAGKSWWIAD